ncbi:uncharacterized protein [Lolium perenne]|uniref:uncharacterized protein n=1 Tax=Lolium perenne TaxID=4522 RepID=UPI0021F558C3|nr:65-kDa microtubule-associated protein 3-like [Lolium perenne]
MAIPPIEDNSEEDGGGGVHLGLGVREGKKARGIGGLGGGERVDEEAQMTGVLGGGEGVEEEVLEQVSRDSGGGGGGDEEDVHGAADSSGSKEEEEDADTLLGRLKALCNVLASNYNDKIDELGIVKGMEITEATKTRLLKIVLFLQETKEERFEKMQDSANELLELWKESEQSTQRLLKVYQIFEIISAHSSDEINEEKYLSAALLRKIEKQIQTIKAANLTLLRDKYQRKRRKLMELLKELHFTTSDVGFDPKEKFEGEAYPEKIKELRGLIMGLKKDRMSRMQLVFRMELLDTIRKEKLSSEKIKYMVEDVKEFLDRAQSAGEILHYDGKNAVDVINEIQEMVTTPKQAERTENNTSSRSMRLEARLKKAMDSEAGEDSLKVPEKCH